MINELRTLAEIEKEVILERLALFSNNKKAAARSLGISVKTIYNKLNQYGKQKSKPEVIANRNIVK